MKLDLLIYGRGTERDDGYQLFANPPYWTEQMLLAMSSFNDLWIYGDLSDSQIEAYSLYQNPWGHTYIFIAMPEPFCCALLRCTRVEDKNGGWLKEARNYDVWSMEGVCCPYKDKEMFWAMIPSVILWLERDNTSLYRRFIDKTIERSIEIPEELLFNPFNEDVMSEEMLSVMQNDMAKTAMVNLCNHIHCSNGPSHFLFGPLTDYFFNTVGDNYAVITNYSTLKSEDMRFDDSFEHIKCIARQKIQESSADYKLKLKLGRKNNAIVSRCWELVEINGKEPSLSSQVTPIDNEKGIDMLDLYFEAEEVIVFAKRLGLTQPDAEGTNSGRFDFKKE